jgi:hypothetical protein
MHGNLSQLDIFLKQQGNILNIERMYETHVKGFASNNLTMTTHEFAIVVFIVACPL